MYVKILAMNFVEEMEINFLDQQSLSTFSLQKLINISQKYRNIFIKLVNSNQFLKIKIEKSVKSFYEVNKQIYCARDSRNFISHQQELKLKPKITLNIQFSNYN